MSFVNGPGGGGFRLNLPKRAVDPQVSTQVMPGAALHKQKCHSRG